MHSLSTWGKEAEAAGVAVQAPQETKQGLLTGVWGPKGLSVCSMVLCTLKMVKRAFNEWPFVGVGLCLRP